jgi:DNA-binding transcriptional LysR family regulator
MVDMDRHVAMETFVRVIDTGSFSGAARQLQVGQPAVSKAIAQLEDWLGVRLLVRSTRGLAPTEAGQSFYVRAKRALEETEQAVLAAREPGLPANSASRRLSAAAAFTSCLSYHTSWKSTPGLRSRWCSTTGRSI